jgi:hypothetical protein
MRKAKLLVRASQDVLDEVLAKILSLLGFEARPLPSNAMEYQFCIWPRFAKWKKYLMRIDLTISVR